MAVFKTGGVLAAWYVHGELGGQARLLPGVPGGALRQAEADDVVRHVADVPDDSTGATGGHAPPLDPANDELLLSQR